MAKLSQCKECKDYHANMNLCRRRWKEVEFDDTTCDLSIDNTTETNACNVKSVNESEVSIRRIGKRGTVKCRSTLDNKPKVIANNLNPAEKDIPSEEIFQNADKANSSLSFKNLFLFIVVVLMGSAGCVYYIMQYQQEIEKQELVKIRVNRILNEIQQEKTLDCLKLKSYKYGDTLLLNHRSIQPIACTMHKDSLLQEFHNMVFLYRDRWKKILDIVGDKDLPIIAVFNLNSIEKNSTINEEERPAREKYKVIETFDSVTTTLSEIGNIIDNTNLYKKAMAVFANRKLYDIADYTERHYTKNGLLKLHSLKLDNDFVRLALAFDDSEVKISASMLDSTKLDPNFIDKVGERGSILNDIFLLCARTHRGFTIEYVGTKKGTHHILSWNYDRTMGFKSFFQLGTDPYQNNNQYGVTLVKERE